MQKLDPERSQPTQLEFTMEDLLQGTAYEAIVKNKAEKLKKAMESNNFSELLDLIRFFRRRLSLSKEDILVTSQMRQYDLITDFVDILKKHMQIDDSNRKIFEEASWAMANYCTGGEHAIESLMQYEFFDVAIDIFHRTNELELFQNVESIHTDNSSPCEHLRSKRQIERCFTCPIFSGREDCTVFPGMQDVHCLSGRKHVEAAILDFELFTAPSQLSF